MQDDGSVVEHQPDEHPRGVLGWWHATPLYLRILGALVIALPVGWLLGDRAAFLETPARLILRILQALAPPLILFAVMQAVMRARVGGRDAARLVGLLALNTLVAIGIGLLVANVLRPGKWARLESPPPHYAADQSPDPLGRQALDTLEARGYKPAGEVAKPPELGRNLQAAREGKGLSLADAAKIAGISPAVLAAAERGEVNEQKQPLLGEGQLVALARAYRVSTEQLTAARKDPVAQFLDNIPKSFVGPFGDQGSVIGVILIAVALGIALRRVREHPVRNVDDLVHVAFSSLLVVLHWVIDLVPFGVFGIVASIVGVQGFKPFLSLGAFVVAVLVALALQATYYLLRVRFGSWVRPRQLLQGCRDALVMAFSTASSTATMPVTYSCLKDRVGVRERSASMGALIGANFNNDGTALYEAMSALFISQMLGQELTLTQQLLVVLTSIVASVGAAGIPEAGLVTMTLVFSAVGLPVRYIALLLTVDWFLDRCRTAINVMGDMNVTCLLDGRQPPPPDEGSPPLSPAPP
jgi:Na+/H+-dicarboxylate symporter